MVSFAIFVLINSFYRLCKIYKIHLLHFLFFLLKNKTFLMSRWTLIYVVFTSQTLMNATWSTMGAVYMSATTYRAIIAALVMTDSIWHMTDITVLVRSSLNHWASNLLWCTELVRSSCLCGLYVKFLTLTQTSILEPSLVNFLKIINYKYWTKQPYFDLHKLKAHLEDSSVNTTRTFSGGW